MKKKLYKIEKGKKFMGVCGGLAEYFNIDATIIRVIWVIAAFLTWSGFFWVYLICGFVMPKKSDLPEELQDSNIYDADVKK